MENVYKKINAAELKNRASRGILEVIDVREPLEFQSENLQGSINIPLSSLEKHLGASSKEVAV